MKFESLIGKTFLENEFYELLLFDIEENFDQYFQKSVHFYFERIPDSKIKITEVVYFKNSREMDTEDRKIIEKKEWFEIAQNYNHVNLILVRRDRKGHISSIERDHTISHAWSLGWADVVQYTGPMTADEKRQAFRELTGYFEDQLASQELRSKKAV